MTVRAEKVTVKTPVAMLESARNEWPEVRHMNGARIVRFAFVFALTGDRNQALAATRDLRIGTNRT